MDESHFDHASEVFGGFFKPSEDTSAFFQPANQSFDDVPLAIYFLVEHDGSGIAVFIFLGGNHWRDFHFQQTIVDPIGSVRFVSC